MGNGATAAAGVQTQAKPAVRAKPAKPTKRGGIRLFEILTDNPPFKIFILLCIIVNSAMLGYDAHFGEANPHHALIEQWNTYFLYVFTAELVLEFLAQGFGRYVRDGWNLFDCVIVFISYAAVVPGIRAITALRTLRVLRVLRLVSNVPQMKRVVEALIGALPGIFATTMVLCVVFYIGAVMATTLFRAEDGFHNLGESALSLFQLTQFDGWGDTIARLDAKYPWAWAFLMSFTVIAAFAVLNLFIGVIVDAVQETRNTAIKEDVAEIEKDVSEIEEDVEDIAQGQEDAVAVQRRILNELTALRSEVAALRGAAAPPPAAG
ncbi:MAG TPA: ion transporter [Caulobacterales bacterium]|nr:ion transporter [Caulobacterales bacterium]